ncbi:hypothetical protein NVIE_2973 [Nitrososphaera viennensis EN76]|uniref:Uncharacterized protein n=1 Tax=Nitrososphaera viennensis EN76 TaxID=926571 RepID=A0A060HVW4_9ARCH|nr:hypothetical protein NVIE_2973 [Nitrososphaera viennensis EN76]
MDDLEYQCTHCTGVGCITSLINSDSYPISEHEKLDDKKFKTQNFGSVHYLDLLGGLILLWYN